jgi:tripartite-type tricarboxylate transporter receptor subunit TctC
MQAELEKVVRSPDVIAKMADQGVQAASSSSAAFGELIARDIGRLRALVKDLGARGD